MEIYTLNLAGLLVLCGALFAAQQRQQQHRAKSRSESADNSSSSNNLNKKTKTTTPETPPHSRRSFLAIYALVMAADWLQGPFLYALYRDEHGVAAATVPALFTAGFTAGAASGSVLGSVADRRGRKAACLFFCAAYALSCVLTAFPHQAALLPMLFAGRVLGGVGTSLLFTVFESWLVADFHRHAGAGASAGGGGGGGGGGDGDGDGEELAETFGLMSTLNSAVAILSGVGSEWLVAATGTRKTPFAASVVLLAVAFGLIWTQWRENYGETGPATQSSPGQSTHKPPKDKQLWTVLTSPKVLSLGLASTVFEGSMYMFVFFWTPALKSARASSSPEIDLPYGVIFASFMAAALAASLAFGMATPATTTAARHAHLLVAILGTAAACFFLVSSRTVAAAAATSSEQTTFWIFCLFEATVGMYWPCIGCLRGAVVDDAVRARVYGVLRVPLNIFVVVSLLLTRAGGADAFKNGKVREKDGLSK
ncbi:hypothetical protein B0T26DRAFT_874691 [Lasiosphaeria miniovina]|uniref:Molybdate-anion transporter n=1 Tax=Lasiosphaeria miniovina TaxID=1954250 RepID=A0AA40DQM1_9PEZI|nr:uncharacterized protein B0T26DRAFT_874691 [Lasiosphaeria miniovina]KAK0709672.1 hypothetical protein B0T26DRAFT_874691 [Lasiosphaeria miniovina]